MIVTEEEAKTKRCQESFGQNYVTAQGGETNIPHLFSISIQHGAMAAAFSSPPLPTVASPSHCIGSACMAWCWIGMRLKSGDISITHEARMAARGAIPVLDDSKPVGYCGKAGEGERL